MPPKTRVTKEAIIDATVDIVRNRGFLAINARNVASALECSTQPIFSNFATMEELRLAVTEKAYMLFNEYTAKEAKPEIPSYKASGMAYIRFAKEEKELFKLLYMRDRSGETIPEEMNLLKKMENIVHNNTGLDEMKSKLFHLEMWAYVHGIASMYATSYLDLDWELVSKMLTDCYQGLRKQYGVE